MPASKSCIYLSNLPDHGHTHSANYNVVFQWSICHCVLKHQVAGVLKLREITEKKISRTSSESIELISMLYIEHTNEAIVFLCFLASLVCSI